MVKEIRRRTAKRDPAVHLLWCGPSSEKTRHAFEGVGIEKIPVDSYLKIENPKDLARMLKEHSNINAVYLNLHPDDIAPTVRSLSKKPEHAGIVIVVEGRKMITFTGPMKWASRIVEHCFLDPAVGLRELPDLIKSELARMREKQ